MATQADPGPAQAVDASDERVELRCGDTQATLHLRGAELCRWHSAGQELLWCGDAQVWPRHSPLLFPIVGRLHRGSARFGALTTTLPPHGFAAAERFELIELGPSTATLQLRATAATRERYPFEFELAVVYRLQHTGIDITLEVGNRGPIPMPYSVGLHPGFAWPFDPSGAQPHRLRFSHAERATVPVITEDGLFTPQQRTLPLRDRGLELAPELFAHEALCWLDAASSALRFEAPDGSAIALQASGFAHWALWSPPGARLLCIEAWTGRGDDAGYEGEFALRPSTSTLAPGATGRHGLQLRHVTAAQHR